MKLVPAVLVVAITAIMVGRPLAQDANVAIEGCPSTGQGIDASVQAVERASNCGRAFEIMKQCSMAGGSDSSIGEAVRVKCEAQFLTKLNGAQRKAYQRELKRCVDKYANEEGSLYISRTAFCTTEQAVRRAARYEKRR